MATATATKAPARRGGLFRGKKDHARHDNERSETLWRFAPVLMMPLAIGVTLVLTIYYLTLPLR
jgi:hypothetical protein